MYCELCGDAYNYYRDVRDIMQRADNYYINKQLFNMQFEKPTKISSKPQHNKNNYSAAKNNIQQTIKSKMQRRR